MVDFQIPLPGLSRDINSLTSQEKAFLAYFAAIDRHSIEPVMDAINVSLKVYQGCQ